MKIISELSALFLLLPAFGAVVVGANGIRSKAARTSRKLQQHCKQCETLPIVFHIFSNEDGSNSAAQLWNDTHIGKEVANLNSKWAETPFKFELRTVTRTTNEAYATGDAGNHYNFMFPLAGEYRLGGKDTVNVFVQDGSSVCGRGGFAHDSMQDIKMFPVDKFSREDYVVLCGMSVFELDENIMTHEIGHWFGLLHTFEGYTCDEDAIGDGIADTPQQKQDSQSTCNVGQDTCEGGGLDLIDNFMDYSSCPDQKFTPGQIDRMYSNYKTFRALRCNPDEAKIGLDFLFDSNADENELNLFTWGSSPPQGFAMLELNEGFSYANQRAASSLCVGRHIMNELNLKDSGSNGFQGDSSYVAYSLNGREAFRGSDFNAEQRVFFSGDHEVCKKGQGRFFLELELDGFAEQIFWYIHKANTRELVLDYRATTVKEATVYQSDFRFGTVLFDICLDAGRYTFTMDKQHGGGFDSGYWKEYVNGMKIYENMPGNLFGGSADKEVNTFTVTALEAPTPSPTPAPTPAPTPKPDVTFCFSGSSTVDVLDQGSVPINDAKLGDKVHVGNGIYEAIYSFGHFGPEEVGEFLEIRTNKNTLQITNDHMVFHAENGPLAARHLQVGDELLDGQGEKLIIQSIKSLSAEGAFAPFTASGKVVVDGILASSFIAFDNGAYLSAAGMQFSYQWIAHSFEFPHRFICTYVSRCDTETYTAEGVSTWVDAPHQLALWMFQQSAFWQALLSALAMVLFAAFNVLDFCLLQHPIAFGLGAVSLLSLTRQAKKA